MDSQYAQPGKAELRSLYTAKRNELDAAKRRMWSSEACSHIAALANGTQVHTVMVYVAFRSELDLHDLIEHCWRNDISVVAPRCTFEDRGMILHELSGFGQLRSGAYGILEPDPALAPQLSEFTVPELILVPGLAFDKSGGRIGYGGGYYDRFRERMTALSASLGKKPIWLGASFEAQLRDEVPGESHDLRLDGVATERGIYWSGSSDS